MRNHSIEQQNIDAVAARFDGSEEVLHQHGIDASNRVPLDIAAAARSVTSDELLAEMEYRSRLNAQRRQNSGE